MAILTTAARVSDPTDFETILAEALWQSEFDFVYTGLTELQTAVKVQHTDAGLHEFDNGESLLDVNGTSLLKFAYVIGAVNQFTCLNSATGSDPTFSVTGTDTNIGVKLDVKGTGRITSLGKKILTENSTDTVINKSLDGNNNTLTNVPGSEVTDNLISSQTAVGVNGGDYVLVRETATGLLRRVLLGDLTSTSSGTSATGINLLAVTGASNTLQGLQNFIHSAGVISAATSTDLDTLIQAGTGLYVTVKAFGCYIRSSNSSIASLYYADVLAVPDTTLQAVTADTNYYILVSWVDAATAPAVSISTADTSNGQNILLLGEVYNNAGSLHALLNIPDKANDHSRIINTRHWETKGLDRVSGSVITETGTRNFALSQGTWWAKGTRLISNTSAFDTSGASRFSYFYQIAGVWTTVTSQSQIDNLQYNDITTGLVPLTAGKYGIHWVYLGVTNGDVKIVYGELNKNLTNARLATASTVLPAVLGNSSHVLIAKIIIKQAGTSFTEVLSIGNTVFQGSSGSGSGSDDFAFFIS